MEFFNQAKDVRLRSHLGKYLVADDDQETVRLSRNSASSRRARWTVELVDSNPHVVRLKSCHGKYLTASEEPFLLGMTGKKVVQSKLDTSYQTIDVTILWEPIKEGMLVKLRTKSGGKFMRANGGTPPWRNSVTHDFPQRSMTQDWVLWTVDEVEVTEFDFDDLSSELGSVFSSFNSNFSSFSADDNYDGEEIGSPKVLSSKSSLDFAREGGMELFETAKTVRLRSHHNKYLLADNDGESIFQDRNGTCENAKWTVEHIQGTCLIRLKSCFDKYLTASNSHSLLGVSGKKVVQTMPVQLDSSVEWEPVREGTSTFQVRLKTQYGGFLRANAGVRNSVTHDIPYRTAKQDWVLWDVEVLETQSEFLPKKIATQQAIVVQESIWSKLKVSNSSKLSKLQSNNSFSGSSTKREGRVIYYFVADDEEVDVDEAMDGASSFNFKGKGVEELEQKLKEETGLEEEIIICSRNLLNGKLYPLKVHLPPNNTTMHVVVVPKSSKVLASLVIPENLI